MDTTRFLFLSSDMETMYSTPALHIDDISSALKHYQGVKTLDDFQSACLKITPDGLETVSEKQLDNQDTSFDGELYLITADHPIFVDGAVIADRELGVDENRVDVYLETWFDCRRLGLQLDMDDGVNVYAIFHYPDDILRVSCFIHYGDDRVSKELFYGSLSPDEEQLIRKVAEDMCLSETGASLKNCWEEYCRCTSKDNNAISASQCMSIRLEAANLETAASSYLSHLLGREIRARYDRDESETLHYWGLWVDATPISQEELEKIFDAVDADDSDRDSTDIGAYPIRELCRGVAERIMEQILPFQVDYSIGMEAGVWFFPAAQLIEINYERSLFGIETEKI